MSSGGSGSGSDLLFFLGVILVIFAVWVGSGGPSRPISFAGPFLNPITAPGTTADPYGDPNSFSPIGSNNNQELPGEASPFRGQVTISRDITGPMNDDPHREYVSLRPSFTATAGVSLQGWRLESSETKKGALLPAAVTLPTSGRVNASEYITLRPGEEVLVTSGRSPTGISFKENMCTGYFEQHQDFQPSLSMLCPTPSQELSAYDPDEECRSFVRSVPQCVSVTRTPSDLSADCESFVEEQLTYSGCVERHKAEPSFYSGTWRLFLNQGDDLWKRERDTILLLDAQGKVVDALSY